MSVRLVNDATALLSMRESDFDAYSAMGEVIDNSIQANAKTITINVKYDAGTTHELIEYIAFGDDGDGMPDDVLHHCLQLGYSTRYNDRSGIGRFGVGATLAAINQCQRIEIYTRQKSYDWMFTYIDLQKIQQQGGDHAGIPQPIQKAPPPHLDNLSSIESGTIVVWNNYDRQPATASAMIEQMLYWIGRTYRYFIWDDGISLILNGQNVPAVDPLFLRTEKTAFPNDPKAEPYTADKINWPVSSIDRSDNSVAESEISIRMSLLPEDFRPNQGAGNTNEAKKRHIPENEGLSILRNRREVFFGRVPYWPGESWAEIDRWWGCEIEFSAILDREFTVKNIKRGAVPVRALKEVLANRIDPTRKTALEQVREVWRKNKSAKNDKNSSPSTGHDAAEDTAANTPTPDNLVDKGKSKNDEAKRVADQLLHDADEQKKAAFAQKFANQPFTITEDNWRGPHFFDTYHLGGSSVLAYNTNHVFFDEINEIRKLLESDPTSNPLAVRLTALIDLLLMAYGKAEAMYDPEMEMKAETFSEDLRVNWGNYLKNYTAKWQQNWK
jgi:hypothetical protein